MRMSNLFSASLARRRNENKKGSPAGLGQNADGLRDVRRPGRVTMGRQETLIAS